MSFFIADEAHNLQIKYSQAVDYPVDLYYLMDLSKSMEDDKQHLSKLGDTLSSTMRNLTSNFRLGFGSFVDKVLMPYVSTVPKKWVIQLFLINFYLVFLNILSTWIFFPRNVYCLFRRIQVNVHFQLIIIQNYDLSREFKNHAKNISWKFRLDV